MTQPSIIDTPFNASAKAKALRDAGIETVIRYYNFRNSSTFPSKRLTVEEAQALSVAGLSVVAVFQQRQNRADDFSREIGLKAGRQASDIATNAIGQPAGSGIYFAVDFDASPADIDARIRPYFQGVREGLTTSGGGAPEYRVGAYGSGLVNRTLKRDGLIELVWISMSRGFRDTRAVLESGDWHLNQLPPATTLLGLGVDFDESNPANPDFGGFTVEEHEAHADLAVIGSPLTDEIGTKRVSARSGLRLRAGPGTNFDVIGVLPLGTRVHVGEIHNGWAAVDRNGDGDIDGFAFAAFLK